MLLLLWMNIMLDVISIGLAELWGTGSEQKIQNENICPPLDLKLTERLRPFAYVDWNV